MKISIMWAISIMLIIILAAVIQFLKKESNSEKETWGQFECGFNIMNPSHLPFSFQFFLIALLFLIFDIEIAILMSYPMEPENLKKTFITAGFLSLLTIGLMYEWQKSKITWSKWMENLIFCKD